MWTDFGPGYQKSSLWVVITDVKHYRPQVGVFWEYLLSQNGFICSNNVVLGDPRRAPKPKIKMDSSTLRKLAIWTIT